MQALEMQDRIIREIRLIPENKLSQIFDFIHFFRLGLETVNDSEDIMQFAGCWQDMTDKEFDDFSEEIRERRRCAFSGRNRFETVID